MSRPFARIPRTARPAQAGLVLAVALALVPAVSADPITIVGDTAHSTEGLGNFSATLTYTPTSASTALLTIALTNTTSPAIGGFLTGFVLNNPGGAITGITFSSTNANFQLLGGPSFNNSVSGSPFGDFDFGAALGGDFLGGGSPNGGIPAGGSATFVFSLVGSGFDLFNEMSFVNALSSDPGGPGAQFFVARFRGIPVGAGSDKVPGQFDDPPPPPPPPPPPIPHIPEPTSLAVWGLVALAGAGYGLRRKRAKTA